MPTGDQFLAQMEVPPSRLAEHQSATDMKFKNGPKKGVSGKKVTDEKRKFAKQESKMCESQNDFLLHNA